MPADAIVVSKAEFYPVKPGKPVTLSVTIGDDQQGGTVVSLNGQLKGSGDDITDLIIDGQDLRNSSIECTTTVMDVNKQSNHTSVSYALRGGVKDRDFTYDVTVSEAGRAIYLVVFLLT